MARGWDEGANGMVGNGPGSAALLGNMIYLSRYGLDIRGGNQAWPTVRDLRSRP